MENRIKALFDLQKFSPNAKLAALIAETEERCVELSDLELEFVSAAGDPFLIPEKERHEKL